MLWKKESAKKGEEKIDENSVRWNSLGAVYICSRKSIMEPKKLIAVTVAAGGWVVQPQHSYSDTWCTVGPFPIWMIRLKGGWSNPLHSLSKYVIVEAVREPWLAQRRKQKREFRGCLTLAAELRTRCGERGSRMEGTMEWVRWRDVWSWKTINSSKFSRQVLFFFCLFLFIIFFRRKGWWKRWADIKMHSAKSSTFAYF